MNKSVIIGMSGGVDSSVAAALLKEQGCQVIGVTMKLWNGEQAEGGCCSLSAVHDARRVADKLGIPFYVMDFQREFNEFVISDFIRAYKAGKTPKPLHCVQPLQIKFDALLAKARAIGADYVATGHYAKIHRQNGSVPAVPPGGQAQGSDLFFIYYDAAAAGAHAHAAARRYQGADPRHGGKPNRAGGCKKAGQPGNLLCAGRGLRPLHRGGGRCVPGGRFRGRVGRGARPP